MTLEEILAEAQSLCGPGLVRPASHWSRLIRVAYEAGVRDGRQCERSRDCMEPPGHVGGCSA